VSLNLWFISYLSDLRKKPFTTNSYHIYVIVLSWICTELLVQKCVDVCHFPYLIFFFSTAPFISWHQCCQLLDIGNIHFSVLDFIWTKEMLWLTMPPLLPVFSSNVQWSSTLFFLCRLMVWCKIPGLCNI